MSPLGVMKKELWADCFPSTLFVYILTNNRNWGLLLRKGYPIGKYLWCSMGLEPATFWSEHLVTRSPCNCFAGMGILTSTMTGPQVRSSWLWFLTRQPTAARCPTRSSTPPSTTLNSAAGFWPNKRSRFWRPQKPDFRSSTDSSADRTAKTETTASKQKRFLRKSFFSGQRLLSDGHFSVRGWFLGCVDIFI